MLNRRILIAGLAFLIFIFVFFNIVMLLILVGLLGKSSDSLSSKRPPQIWPSGKSINKFIHKGINNLTRRKEAKKIKQLFKDDDGTYK